MRARREAHVIYPPRVPRRPNGRRALIAAAGAVSLIALVNCGGDEEGGGSGAAGGAGGSGGGGQTGGSAGVDAATGGSAGASSGGTGGGSTGGIGGAGGTAGTNSGGTGGSAGGSGGGVTGGTGGTATGGTGGSPGGTGGVGGVGGTGATGGTTGGTGGTGGTPCVEPSMNEIIQLCQGNCGTVPHKCDAGTYNCLVYVPANACTTAHQWCQLKADGSGTCGGCTRKTSSDVYCAGMVQPQPFYWTCPTESGDGVQNWGETDIDCGGPYSPGKCSSGVCGGSSGTPGYCTYNGKSPYKTCSTNADCTQACAVNSDCELQTCLSGKCANSTKAKIGCALKPGFTGGWCCPESQNGCSRAPSMDSPICGSVAGKPYAMQCPAGKTLASAGCTSSSGFWCCASTMP